MPLPTCLHKLRLPIIASSLFIMIAMLSFSPSAKAQAGPDGQALQADVEHYAQLGVHRFGSRGHGLAMAWMAEQLAATGLKVSMQNFSLHKQYEFEHGTLQVGNRKLEVVPQWWMPKGENKVTISASIAADGDASGRFVRLKIPYDRGAYLGPQQKDAIAAAMQRHPAAILLSIDHPSGEIFTYNVDQEDAPWPVPVILVAPKDDAVLEQAQLRGETLSLSVSGRYASDLQGSNVIARLDRGKTRTVVLSTPVSSWFVSACERGPGIAAFLASAEMAVKELQNVNLVFVATSGHEIGHGGMASFLVNGAPKPAEVAAWVHFGASLACRGPGATGDNRSSRFLAYSGQVSPQVESGFADVVADRRVGARANIGELREIMAAGYVDVFGLAGLHHYFHTPVDTANLTSPELMLPVVQAFFNTLRAIDKAPR